MTVTRDYGSQQLQEQTLTDPPESQTVLRALDGAAEITTRYSGGFVHSIDGIEGTATGSRRFDWFFYVNGIESSVGAAEVDVRAGDRIWWDYRDWTDAMRVPAVVGAWPQPFAAESGDSPASEPVELSCAGPHAACEEVADRLDEIGADVDSLDAGAEGSGDHPRVLVGTWAEVGEDHAASQIDRGPSTSGVFARFEPTAGGERLVTLDEQAQEVDALGVGSGLVAAVREGDDDPTWMVTGTDERGVRAAAALLDATTLRNRYAVASDGKRIQALPVIE